MPKQYKTYNRFDGGLNTKADARDLADNELASASNLAVDIIGKVQNLGAMVAHTDIGTKSTNIKPGYNLFSFHSDYTRGDASFQNAGDTGEDWIAFADHQQDNGIHLYNPTDDAWYSKATTSLKLGTSTGSKVVFFYGKGALRASDANFGSANRNKWWGYIKRTHFNGLTPGGSADDYDGWYAKNNDLSAPIRGIVGDQLGGPATSSDAADGSSGMILSRLIDSWPSELDTEMDSSKYIAVNRSHGEVVSLLSRTDTKTLVTDSLALGDNDWTGDDYAIYPDAGTGFVLDLDNVGSGGSWSTGTFEFASTFIYDGNQESQLYEMDGTFTIGASSSVTATVFATSPFDPRITGGRIYLRTSGSDEAWTLFLDISLRDGIRAQLDVSYSAWILDTGRYVYATTSSVDINLDTYETLNGFSQDEPDIAIGDLGMGYKDVTILNNRAWTFHPKAKNEDGETVEMGDRIMYSPVGKYDTFPTSFYIDIATDDGDSFVAGKGFADRILAFKKNKLYIINVAQGSDTGWYIEAEHNHLGVEHKASVFKTDYGIVWCNKFGVYFYDGNRISELTSKLAESTWDSFFQADQSADPTIIGFEPKKKQVIVMQDASALAGNGNAYVYDMRTKSWVYGDSVFSDDTDKGRSNFVIDWEQRLIHAYKGGVFNEWDNDPQTSGSWELTLKDDDFGYPALNKKIYDIVVTYKSDIIQSNSVKYATNGGTSFTAISGDFAVNSDWAILKLSPSISGTIQSLQLRIDPPLSGKVEINDITVVYRIIPKVVS